MWRARYNRSMKTLAVCILAGSLLIAGASLYTQRYSVFNGSYETTVLSDQTDLSNPTLPVHYLVKVDHLTGRTWVWHEMVSDNKGAFHRNAGWFQLTNTTQSVPTK